jgi:hypothetical protein
VIANVVFIYNKLFNIKIIRGHGWISDLSLR